MSIDYIVASLPALAFDGAAPMDRAKFEELVGAENLQRYLERSGWRDLETQLRNAMAEARGGASCVRPASGCSLYWKKRMLDCFGERDIAKRDELIDRVWWDAAGELTPPASPLSEGALATYALRLRIAHKRAAISRDRGNAAFDRLTAETKNL